MPIRYYTREEIIAITSVRAGEVKWGEKLEYASDIASIHNRLVVLGIAEDIGVMANNGRPGAKDTFDIFMSYWVNMQSNRYIDSHRMVLGGCIRFDELYEQISEDTSIEELRDMVTQIDDEVSQVIEILINNGNTPIIIGGGHNNAYGIIKGVSRSLGRAVSVLNIDPHLDYRALEGRHSGNGFSYAKSENWLRNYTVYGSHSYYNNESMLEIFESDAELNHISYESMMIDNSFWIRYIDMLEQLDNQIGLELDLDSIAGMPVSAYTPVGWDETYVRQMVHKAFSSKEILYYHIAEGAANYGSAMHLGKFIAYLVMDRCMKI